MTEVRPDLLYASEDQDIQRFAHMPDAAFHAPPASSIPQPMQARLRVDPIFSLGLSVARPCTPNYSIRIAERAQAVSSSKPPLRCSRSPLMPNVIPKPASILFFIRPAAAFFPTAMYPPRMPCSGSIFAPICGIDLHHPIKIAVGLGIGCGRHCNCRRPRRGAEERGTSHICAAMCTLLLFHHSAPESES